MQTDEISRIPIRILLEGSGETQGEFIRFLAPRTVDALLRVLPLQGRVAIWKEQVYFQVPLKIGPEKATPQAVEGDIAYWPMGNAICIFVGSMQTHGPINHIGKNLSNLEMFRKVQSGTRIRVERTSDYS
jgi:hypothetical protein